MRKIVFMIFFTTCLYAQNIKKVYIQKEFVSTGSAKYLSFLYTKPDFFKGHSIDTTKLVVNTVESISIFNEIITSSILIKTKNQKRIISNIYIAGVYVEKSKVNKFLITTNCFLLNLTDRKMFKISPVLMNNFIAKAPAVTIIK